MQWKKTITYLFEDFSRSLEFFQNWLNFFTNFQVNDKKATNSAKSTFETRYWICISHTYLALIKCAWKPFKCFKWFFLGQNITFFKKVTFSRNMLYLNIFSYQMHIRATKLFFSYLITLNFIVKNYLFLRANIWAQAWWVPR